MTKKYDYDFSDLKYECILCGIEGTEANELSKCHWSLLGSHHWVNSETLRDRYGVKQQ